MSISAKLGLWASKMLIMRCLVLGGFIAATLIGSGVVARAATSTIKGVYAIAGISDCLFSTETFNADLTTAGSTYSVDSRLEGYMIFNGDGTGRVQLYGVGVSSTGASVFQANYNFTYTSSGNDQFHTTMVPDTFSGSFTAGVRMNQTYSVDSVDSDIVVGTSALAEGGNEEVQVETYSNTDVRYRICADSRTLVETKISPSALTQ